MTETEQLPTGQTGRQLIAILRKSGLTQSISDALSQDRTIMVCGADGAQKTWIEETVRDADKPAIIIVPEHKDVQRWEEDLQFFCPELEIFPFLLWKRRICGHFYRYGSTARKNAGFICSSEWKTLHCSGNGCRGSTETACAFSTSTP